MENVIVLGASKDPDRYSNMAVRRLVEKGHSAIPLGIQAGEIQGIQILDPSTSGLKADTLTVYLNPVRQGEVFELAKRSQVKRVIFNPGAENPDLEASLRAAGYDVQEACTLVLLSTGQF